VNPKLTLRFLITVLIAAFSLSAVAAPKDGAALKKVDEAINVHYLATEFDKAEAMLLGVIKACGKDCSPAVIGKAYMYVGLVRGCGKNNLAGAKDAFEKAKAADPGVALDAALATPEVQAEFNKAGGGGGAAAPAAAKPVAATAAAGGAEPSEAAGGLSCTPAAGYEIQTRQPIPISCTPPAGVTKGELNYKSPNGDGFKTVPMKVEGGTLRAQIPCDGVAEAGSLKWYVIAQDAKGDTIDTLGNELGPAEFNVVAQSAQPAPAFPGGQPPARCGAANGTGNEGNECPPGMPGCKSGGGWGDSCTPADKCKKGLYCASGTCENAPSCETNADCDSGRCTDGFCQMGDSAGAGKYRRLMVGLHFAPDVWITSKTQDVCGHNSALAGTYSCYQKGTSTIDPSPTGADSMATVDLGAPGFAGNINSGMSLATIRLLASLDYALTPNVTVGGRAGFAFRGGPPSIKYNAGVPEQTTKFFPFHVEARAAYWFKALSMPGIHPYVHLGGGMAQVDGKVTVQAYRNALSTCKPGATGGPNNSITCSSTGQWPLQADGTQFPQSQAYPVASYDAWRKMGQGFGTVGGGALFPLGENGGVLLNLNIMFMLPSSGTVLEPSLGYVLGL
jgi:hypothetical protein